LRHRVQSGNQPLSRVGGIDHVVQLEQGRSVQRLAAFVLLRDIILVGLQPLLRIFDRGNLLAAATAQAEADYVKLIRSLAQLRERFYMECTPGYYNREGAPGNKNGFFSETYGAGSVKFFELLDDWRTESSLKGIALS
jgi:hypothetical protein